VGAARETTRKGRRLNERNEVVDGGFDLPTRGREPAVGGDDGRHETGALERGAARAQCR
jgi:hypothetical protein